MSKIFNRKKQTNSLIISSTDDNEIIPSPSELSNAERSTSENLKSGAVELAKGSLRVAQHLDFAPLITTIFKVVNEIVVIYDKAKHNKELCGFLLTRCNFAVAAVKDLDMRRTEYVEFFSKKENFEIIKGFSDCIRKIREFASRVSKLNKLMKYLSACSVEDDLRKLVEEFDSYMASLNFSFTLKTRDESMKIKDFMSQIHESLFEIYAISITNRQSQQDFQNKLTLAIDGTKNFISEDNMNEFKNIVEENEPFLNGKDYQKSEKTDDHSKEIEKRTSFKDSTDVSFSEFSNIDSSDEEIKIRREVNILKLLKNSDHIIRFFGVAKEDSKFYLVTEWMDYGNLREYYTNFRDNMNLETKIRFSLNICRGVAYLHDCEILHRDIQSVNILVNKDHKVRISNFGLSRKFTDATRSVSHDSENVRYMAPEKLLLKKDEKRKYDENCEIYSVGVLLWEIAELKKPHSDLDKSMDPMELVNGIRERIRKNYHEPFSDYVPSDWQYVVHKAMDYEPKWRPNMSSLCRDFYKLSEKYSNPKQRFLNIKILSVDDAIREHESNFGDKQLTWNSFKFHSITNVEARFWVGYYYQHHGEIIPELQPINKEKRIKTAIDIFKETANKGNPSAQLRYGIYLWESENYIDAFKYLKMSADANEVVAMYNVGKAYWNGGKGIEQDKEQGAKYLKLAASKNHDKAIKMCNENNISY